jgi:tetratricopeptide (TPR) repeat protein
MSDAAKEKTTPPRSDSSKPGFRLKSIDGIICLILAIATAWIYWSVHSHEFIVLDDLEYLVTNPVVKSGLNENSIHWAFTQNYASNWHPLTWMSHMLDCQLFQMDAGKHHLVNVGLHIINSLLLFLLLFRLTGARWRSAFVAALFAVHPVHVESVAWVAERKDVLSTLFFMLTLLAYARYAEFSARPGGVGRGIAAKRTGFYLAALILFALGLMSKPMLVTLPFVLLLLDFWPLARLEVIPWKSQSLVPRVLEKVPFFILSGISCRLTIWAQQSGQAIKSVESFPIYYRISNSLTAYLGYIGKLFWPVKLSVFYPFPDEAPTETAILAALLLAAFSIFALMAAKRRPYLLVGWFWFLGTLVPVIGLLQVGSQSMADRYTYIPLTGLFIVISWAAVELTNGRKYQRPGLATLAVVSVAVCAVLAAQRVAVWQNTKTLFTDALRVDERNYLAWTTVGNQFALEGDYQKATNYLSHSLALRPDDATSWHGLGLALAALDKSPEAEDAFQKSIKLEPWNVQTHDTYAAMLIHLGRFDDALVQLAKADEINPNFLETRVNRLNLLQLQGKLVEAAAACKDILQLDPTYNTARIRLASIYFTMGRPDQAVIYYREALSVNPTNHNARVGLGMALVETHQLAEADAEFSHVLLAEPQNAQALDGRGFVLATKGQIDEAKKTFLEAIKSDPNFPDAHMHYGMCLSAQNQAEEAVAEYRKALELGNQRPITLNNLAWALASHPDPKIRNGKEAVELAEKACQLTGNQQPLFLGTLAAAYAEAGRFNEAVAAAERARDLARTNGWEQIAQRNEQLLELYRASKPYHESNGR